MENVNVRHLRVTLTIIGIVLVCLVSGACGAAAYFAWNRHQQQHQMIEQQVVPALNQLLQERQQRAQPPPR